jgi:hypothetical protein
MLRSRRLLALATLALAAVAISCSRDGVTAPRSATTAIAPNASLLGGIDDLTSRTLGLRLLTCRVTQSAWASERIGPAGGVLRVGAHTLVVPRGALDSAVTITAYAPAGDRVEVAFEPHGLQFDRTAALTLSYRDCGVLGGLLTKVVYIDRGGNILETLLSVPDLWHQTVTGSVHHFSSYAVAY